MKIYRQQGIGIMEILISILVLSIGLLGLAGLQAVGLKNNSQSFDRSYAVFLANNILDRIRANPTADYTTGINDAPSVAANSCETGTCNANALRDYDLAQWKCLLGRFNQNGNCVTFTSSVLNPANNQFQNTQLQGLLSDGTGSITRVVTGSTTRYTISIEWADPTNVTDPNDPANTGVNKRSNYTMVTDI
ncbi:type IV pilus modification protein PilV [Spartinivicinus poritis]|uniref:Type IV pilus modification protein PilV n=1 Tax=Spartinivicinus poritis TaxID=2994640 RepID=A0ABT5U8M8_9GAMM|nr:type IV pilus modification protein PilV [Spartinivicinus sp. A2-2]MDE1462555.1 type IV pilus modification protein PilV [Spartinivicinus sp. A2-2]